MRDERQYVVEVMTAFLSGSGARRDWDDFLSTPLRDVELERIRQCAAVVRRPLNAEGVATLQALLHQAELARVEDPAGPKLWRMEAGLLTGLAAGALLWWDQYLPGAGIFHNLHLLLVPPVVGAFLVGLRNSREKVGIYDPEIVAQNRKGRV